MEKVNHPSHYNILGKKECIVQMQEDFGPYITVIFCLTNVFKYLYRAGNKPGESFQEAISKARFYHNYYMGIDVGRNMLTGNDFVLLQKVEEMLENLEGKEKSDGNDRG